MNRIENRLPSTGRRPTRQSLPHPLLALTIFALGLGCAAPQQKVEPVAKSAAVAPSSASSASAAPAPIPGADAVGMVRTIEGATSQREFGDPDRTDIFLNGCSEIPSCAGACAEPLHKSGSVLTREADRDGILGSCFEDFKRDHEKGGLSRGAWIERRVAALADRALAEHALAGSDAELLRKARSKLHVE